MKKIERFQFSREGDGMAHVTYPITLEAPYDPPDPISLDEAAVGEVVEAHREEIARLLGKDDPTQIEEAASEAIDAIAHASSAQAELDGGDSQTTGLAEHHRHIERSDVPP